MTVKITCVVDDAEVKTPGLKTEHGLSMWIETDSGAALYDTGKTAAVLSNNLRQLGLDPAQISALALSHGHNDHTGGLEYILSIKKGLPLYAHADIFRPRFAKRENSIEDIGIPLTRQALVEMADLRLSEAPVEILNNLWTAGGVTDRPEPEGGGAHLFIPGETSLQPDIYKDDLSLVLKTSHGLVLITGCCHAGLLNTLNHVQASFGGPILAVMGGTHLISAKGDHLEHIIGILAARYPHLRFYLNHCTGENAINKLAAAFGDRVLSFRVGSTAVFAD